MPIRFSLARALVVGSLAGLIGGWAFGSWMGQSALYPALARVFGSDSVGLGATIHYIIAVVLGASFGLLFQRDIRRWRFKPGLGGRLRFIVVVFGAAHFAPPRTRPDSGLVIPTRQCFDSVRWSVILFMG